MDRLRILRSIGITGLLVLGVVTILFGLRVALGTPNPFYVVSSSSMTPQLNVGDWIVVRDTSSFQELEEGDIIVFYRPEYHDRVLVHRIVSMTLKDGERHIFTKGDANPNRDNWIVRETDYIGKVVFTVPRAGMITAWLTPPVNYFLIAVIVVLIFVTELKQTKRRGKSTETSAG